MDWQEQASLALCLHGLIDHCSQRSTSLLLATSWRRRRRHWRQRGGGASPTGFVAGYVSHLSPLTSALCLEDVLCLRKSCLPAPDAGQ